MQTNEKNKVSYVYFIMSILVILIHSVNNEGRFERLFSITGIGKFATPLLFVISGFLFFRNVENIADVKIKLKKRIYTLLIPYILWNLIYYVIHLLFIPGQAIDIMTVYDAAMHFKYNPTFWFVYQLILLNILSLALVYIVKNEKYIIAFYIFIAALIVFAIDIPYVNEDAIIYFFSGALFSKLYNRGKVLFISKRNFLIMLLGTICMFAINRGLHLLILSTFYYNLFILSTIFVRLSMALTIFYFFDVIFSYNKVYKFMENTFFLYAIHYAIVRLISYILKFITYKIIPVSMAYSVEILFFVASPIVCVTVCFYLSRFMKKRFSKIYYILTGNR